MMMTIAMMRQHGTTHTHCGGMCTCITDDRCRCSCSISECIYRQAANVASCKCIGSSNSIEHERCSVIFAAHTAHRTYVSRVCGCAYSTQHPRGAPARNLHLNATSRAAAICDICICMMHVSISISIIVPVCICARMQLYTRVQWAPAEQRENVRISKAGSSEKRSSADIDIVLSAIRAAALFSVLCFCFY
jgi:hypothetical protein